MHKNLLAAGISCLLITGFSFSSSASVNAPKTVAKIESDTTQLIGRWDITIDENGKSAPSWLEVKLSGVKTLVGYFVGASGSARPVARVTLDNGKFGFTIPPQWEAGDQDFVIKGDLAASGINGTITTSAGKTYNWKGIKAPYLKKDSCPCLG
jgi:hypothetical protein